MPGWDRRSGAVALLSVKWSATVGLVLVLVAVACGGRADGTDPVAASTTVPLAAATVTTSIAIEEPGSDGCAHVIAGEIAWQGEVATISATVSSADTGWDKYADAWEVRTVEGEVLGVRELAHPHENEQPFTRSLSGVSIPESETEVVLAARDSVEGWCGETFAIEVPSQP